MICRQCQRDPDEYDRALRRQADKIEKLEAELTTEERQLLADYRSNDARRKLELRRLAKVWSCK